MSDLPDFSDREAVEVWFQTHPRQVGEAVAARAALRTFPAVLADDVFKHPEKSAALTLSVLRSGLVSAAAATCENTERDVLEYLKASARSAYLGAEFSATLASSNAKTVVFRSANAARCVASASFASYASHATYTAAEASSTANRSDIERALADLTTAFNVPLWEEPSPLAGYYSRLWLSFQAKAKQRPAPVWDFWLRWYQAIWDGEPLDWALTREVALIGDDVWNEGPEAVAAAIRAIEHQFRTQVAERLVLNEATGKHDIADEDDLEQDILDFVQERITIALKTALAADSGNGLQETSPETSEIRDGLASKNPSVVAATFYAASVSISCKLNDGAYPDEVSLRNLKNALYGAKEEICEAHPKARERCERLAALGQPPSDIGNDDRTMIEGLVPAMFDQLEPRAMEIYQSDVERILSEEGATRLSWARVSNWTTIISGHIDSAMKNDKRAKWLADVASRLWKLWQGDE